MRRIFWNRTEGGKELARVLTAYAGRTDVLVLAIPRGGVPVAYEVAHSLRVPLDVLVVRKLCLPSHRELAFGAVAPRGLQVLDQELIAGHGLSPEDVERVSAQAREELQRLELVYRGELPRLDIAHRTIIVVDDGLATGSTMRAAVLSLRKAQAAHILVAVPTAPADAVASLRTYADEVVVLSVPDPYLSIGSWYRDFSPLEDEEVRKQLTVNSEQ